MRIAVTTPTGNVGRHVVAMLVRAGVRPLVLARDPDRLDAAVRDHVDTVAVDQADGDAVVAATAGVDALYWVDPPSAGADPLADYDRLGANAARAVTENGIARTVFQSSIGAEKRHGAGEISGLGRTEEALDATGAAVTHLRCGFFFTNLLMQLDAVRAGTLPITWPVEHALPWVAPRDIAEVASLRLLSDDWTGRSVRSVDGPEHLTWTQAAAVVTAATGHELTVEQIADDDMRELLRGAGMTDGLIEAVLGMSVGLREGFVPEQSRTFASTTPTTLAAWAYDELRPLLREGTGGW